MMAKTDLDKGTLLRFVLLWYGMCTEERELATTIQTRFVALSKTIWERYVGENEYRITLLYLVNVPTASVATNG